MNIQTRMEAKEFDIKIGTEKEALWRNYKTTCEKTILNSEADIEIGKMGIELAEKKIKEEQDAL